MHTDPTVDHLQQATAEFATCLRKIGSELRDLPTIKGRKGKDKVKESDKKGKKKTTTHAPLQPELNPSMPSFNCNTVKLHSLGDYARTILRLGTTDSYSTSLVWHSFHHNGH